MKPPFPPTGVTVAEPSLSPLQVASFTLDTEQLNGAGSVSVAGQAPPVAKVVVASVVTTT